MPQNIRAIVFLCMASLTFKVDQRKKKTARCHLAHVDTDGKYVFSFLHVCLQLVRLVL